MLTDSKGNIHLGRSPSNLKKYGEKGALLVGRTLHDATPVFSDSLSPHVMFLVGTRGTGKSYTLGVVAEELAKNNKNVATVIVDPIGVFWSMKLPNAQEKEIEMLKEWGLSPYGFDNVVSLVPAGAEGKVPKETYDETFSLKPSELTVDDWCLTFGLERFSPAGLLLERAITKAGEKYTLSELASVIANDKELSSKDKGFSKQTRRGMISRLDAANEWGVLSKKGTPIERICYPGRVTVLDVSFLEESVAALVVGIFARKILEARKIAVRAEAAGHDESRIPPTWLMIDEAHTLVPTIGSTAASEALIEYVKQGRRPGCSLVIATQQPSAINSKLLSQIDLMMVHKLVFQDDIKSVFKRMPSSMDETLKDVNVIRTLPLGAVVVGDKEEENPAFMMRVRPRQSQHEGRSMLAVKAHVPVQVEELEDELEEKPNEPVTETKPGDLFAVAPEIDFTSAKEKAERMLHRKLGLFRSEHIIGRRLVYYPLYSVLVDYPSLRKSRLCYVDGILGELFARERTRGVIELKELDPIELRVSLNADGTVEQIRKKVRLDEKTTKRMLNRLVKHGYVSLEGEKYVSKNYALPEFDRLVFPSLSPEFIEKNGTVLSPEIDEKEIESIFSLFGKAKLKSKELTYYPYWAIRTDKRVLAIDAVTGEPDPDAATVLSTRI